MPGWRRPSIGYHGDDGNIFRGQSHLASGLPFGGATPPFTAGDTVGCGIDSEDNSCFYTLNGRYLGVAASGLPEDLESAHPMLSSTWS